MSVAISILVWLHALNAKHAVLSVLASAQDRASLLFSRAGSRGRRRGGLEGPGKQVHAVEARPRLDCAQHMHSVRENMYATPVPFSVLRGLRAGPLNVLTAAALSESVQDIGCIQRPGMLAFGWH